MPKPEDLTRLNRHELLSSLASFGVVMMGLICLALYIEPSWTGVNVESRGIFRGEIVWLVVGIVLAFAGTTFLYISIHWPGQLKRIVLHTRPTKGKIKLEVRADNDSMTYYAIISQQTTATGETPVWRAHSWVYPPKIKEDIGKEFEGEVFLRPETGLPVAIEYSKGMLWVISGNGAVKRV